MREDLDRGVACLLTVHLDPGEALLVEPGAMVAQMGVQIKTKTSGGFGKALGKAFLGGESFFLNTFTADPQGGWISMAPASIGEIQGHDIPPGVTLTLQKGSYMASTVNVTTDTKFQGGKGFFSGEGLFLLTASNAGPYMGRVWMTSFGCIKELMVSPGQELVVDTGNLVAFETAGLTYKVKTIGGLKSVFFGGEGLVMSFSGQGRVWIQTREPQGLAGALAPFLPGRS